MSSGIQMTVFSHICAYITRIYQHFILQVLCSEVCGSWVLTRFSTWLSSLSRGRKIALVLCSRASRVRALFNGAHSACLCSSATSGVHMVSLAFLGIPLALWWAFLYAMLFYLSHGLWLMSRFGRLASGCMYSDG